MNLTRAHRTTLGGVRWATAFLVGGWGLSACGGSELTAPSAGPTLAMTDWSVAGVDLHPQSDFDIHSTLVADARGDGIKRVYNSEAGIAEYTYSNQWFKTRAISERVGHFLDGRLHDDGRPRLYAFTERRVLVELEWGGSSWTSRPIPLDIPVLSPTSPVIGDPRNEGRSSLYLVAEKALHEVRYNSDGWTRTVIDPAAARVDGSPAVTGMVVGRARRDGQARLYLVSVTPQQDSQLIEYAYAGGAWAKETIITFGPESPRPWPLGLAPDENGQPTLIFLGGDLWEVAFDGRAWQKRLDRDLIRFGADCAGGAPRSDRRFRIYCAGSFGRLEELSRGPNAWTRTAEWQVSETALKSIAIGEGRADGVTRLYTQTFFVWSAQALHEWTALR